MQNRSPDPAERDILPQRVADRVLARASVLDAAHASDSTVAALRAAALEAGISASAFDAALAEVRDEQAPAPRASERPRRSLRIWAFAAAIAGLVAVSRLVVPGGAAPVAPGVPMVEEGILLQCLSPGEAAELIRPLLDLPQNTILHSPEQAPRVLTIHGTPSQLEKVKALLEPYEREGSTACARPLPPRE